MSWKVLDRESLFNIREISIKAYLVFLSALQRCDKPGAVEADQINIKNAMLE